MMRMANIMTLIFVIGYFALAEILLSHPNHKIAKFITRQFQRQKIVQLVFCEINFQLPREISKQFRIFTLNKINLLFKFWLMQCHIEISSNASSALFFTEMGRMTFTFKIIQEAAKNMQKLIRPTTLNRFMFHLIEKVAA